VRWALALTLCERAFLFTFSYSCTLCFNVLPRSLCARVCCWPHKYKTREFQMQLLHYFYMCDNKSNHHHLAPAVGRTKSPDCVLYIPVSHHRRRVCLSFLLIHPSQAFWAWCTTKLFNLSVLLPNNWFISTKSHLMQHFVNWIPLNPHVRSNKTEPWLMWKMFIDNRKS